MEVGPPIGGETFLRKVATGDEGPFETRKFRRDGGTDADATFVGAERTGAIFEIGAVIATDSDETKVIVKSEITDEIVTGSKQLGLEMFFQDRRYFVIVVSKPERFDAKEWHLDARFGHVAVIAAESPTANEGFDRGLGAVFGEDASG